MAEALNKGRVIVTYGRSLIALMIAQSLGSRGIEVIGCDDVKMTVLSFSQFVAKNHVYTAAHKDEERFIADLLQIAKDHKPDDGRPYVLIPVFTETKVIAKYKERFEDLITVAAPDFESIDRIDPKDHFARTLQNLDITAPQTWLPEGEDIRELAQDVKFPVMIKPPNDVGGRGISKIKKAEDLQPAYDKLRRAYPGEQIVLQEAVGGTDYCYCGLFDKGRRVTSMVYHNLEKFPREAGPGVLRETVESDQFDAIADTLMAELQWSGVVEIDFLWDEREDSAPMMIEVNPRFWMGLDHSIKSNIDFPYLLYRLFVDGHVETDSLAKIGYKTSLPGLASMGQIEELFSNTIQLEKLQDVWPDIRKALRDKEWRKAFDSFKNALDDTITVDEAFHRFKILFRQEREAEKISYTKDDPFIGLGMLFVLAHLIQHGHLPPELKR